MSELPEKFVERMGKMLYNKGDIEKYISSLQKNPKKAIRCNTIKITSKKLQKRLESKGWKIEQPFKNYPEAIIIKDERDPGDIGNSKEHLIGYYYSQGLESMMPILALNPTNTDLFLDLTASPGSKTTQACQNMKNRGVIIANDDKPLRIKTLNLNLSRMGCSNTIVFRHDAVQLCKKLKKMMRFDKILIDPSCSGEGKFRDDYKAIESWSEEKINMLSQRQKKIAASSIGLLKKGGEILYSTCTYSPEENEEVVDFLIKNFDLEIKDIELPLESRPGLTDWKGKRYSHKLKKAKRIYPQDNNTDGFFLAKLKKQI